jgi:hypothetical protein
VVRTPAAAERGAAAAGGVGRLGGWMGGGRSRGLSAGRPARAAGWNSGGPRPALLPGGPARTSPRALGAADTRGWRTRLFSGRTHMQKLNKNRITFFAFVFVARSNQAGLKVIIPQLRKHGQLLTKEKIDPNNTGREKPSRVENTWKLPTRCMRTFNSPEHKISEISRNCRTLLLF